MKPIYEAVPFEPNALLRISNYQQPHFDTPLHYHPEYELTLIIKGYGKRFIGNHVEEFEAGDLILIGKNLSHVWINDRDFYQKNSGLVAEAVVVQFDEKILSESLLAMREFYPIAQLLEKSAFGIKILEPLKTNLYEAVISLAGLKGVLPYTHLLEVLNQIALDENYEVLCATKHLHLPKIIHTDRINKISQYLQKNYHQDVSLTAAANLVNMDISAFCRYFKQQTGKTFSEYLNQLRINYACKLLIDGGRNVSQICYECGYNNLSHFNRQFRRIIGKSPSEYRKMYRFEPI